MRKKDFEFVIKVKDDNPDARQPKKSRQHFRLALIAHFSLVLVFRSRRKK